MSEPPFDCVVIGSGPLPGLVAGVLAQSHRKRVALIGAQRRISSTMSEAFDAMTGVGSGESTPEGSGNTPEGSGNIALPGPRAASLDSVVQVARLTVARATIAASPGTPQ